MSATEAKPCFFDLLAVDGDDRLRGFDFSLRNARTGHLDAVEGGGLFRRCGGGGVLRAGEGRGQGKRDADGQKAALHRGVAMSHLFSLRMIVSCGVKTPWQLTCR